MTAPSTELVYTTWSTALTGTRWVPIIINRLREMGIWKALRNPELDVRPHAPWAYRLAHAHRNAIENLVVFAPLDMAVHMLGPGTSATATAAALFFWSRLAHAAIYTFGIPLLRTVAFLVGFGAQATMVVRLMASM